MRTTANALAFETDEVPVSSNEMLQANIVAIRTDVTDLKTDFRTVVARIDEQFREVRQDIRELRAANDTLRDKTDVSYSSLNNKIDATRESLDQKIEATRESLDKKIDATRELLEEKIEATHESLDKKINATRELLEEKIEATHESLDRKIDATRELLDHKIDTKVDELRADMTEMRADMKGMRADIQTLGAGIAGLRGMQKAILWILGGLSTVVAIVGGGLAIAKSLEWI